jgi:rubredoxin
LDCEDNAIGHWFDTLESVRGEGIKMKQIEEKTVCALCGYTASGRFVGDICLGCGLTYWKCGNCDFLVTAAVPPDVSPECGEKCDFLDVPSYIPDFGGVDNIDPRL